MEEKGASACGQHSNVSLTRESQVRLIDVDDGAARDLRVCADSTAYIGTRCLHTACLNVVREDMCVSVSK